MAGVLEMSAALEETSATGADNTPRSFMNDISCFGDQNQEDVNAAALRSPPAGSSGQSDDISCFGDQNQKNVNAAALKNPPAGSSGQSDDISCFGDQNQKDVNAAALRSPPAGSSGQSDEKLSIGERNDDDQTCHGRTGIRIKEEEDDICSEANLNPSVVNSSREETSSSDNPVQLPDDSSVISSSMANDDPSARDRTCCRRMSISSKKEFWLMIASTVNVMAEILALTLEQLGGKNHFKLLLVCGALAFVSLILGLTEIHMKGDMVDFYLNILGLLFAISQLDIIVIGGILLKITHKNPIQISINSLIFAVMQLVFGVAKKRRRVHQISQPNDATA